MLSTTFAASSPISLPVSFNAFFTASSALSINFFEAPLPLPNAPVTFSESNTASEAIPSITSSATLSAALPPTFTASSATFAAALPPTFTTLSATFTASSAFLAKSSKASKTAISVCLPFFIGRALTSSKTPIVAFSPSTTACCFAIIAAFPLVLTAASPFSALTKSSATVLAAASRALIKSSFFLAFGNSSRTPRIVGVSMLLTISVPIFATFRVLFATFTALIPLENPPKSGRAPITSKPASKAP